MGIFKKPGFGLFSGSAGTPNVRNARLKKVKAEKAADICKLFELQEQARELLTEEIGPADFFRLLGKNRLYRDAVNFLSHGLPVRDAVWWGCRCTRTDPVLAESAGAARALEAAEKWVTDPSEANRETARRGARKAVFEMPDAVTAWLATAAAASEGSLCPPCPGEEPPRDDTLAARGVAGAVLLAASREEKEFKSRIVAFLDLGVQVADGPGTEESFSAIRSSQGAAREVE